MNLPFLRNRAQDVGAGCHAPPQTHWAGLPQITIVGNPNVGKSALFNRLTGSYVSVSNYPGTTVEVARGQGTVNGQTLSVVDTPGLYSLMPGSEEERVTYSLLFDEPSAAVIHVVEARNLERMLALAIPCSAVPGSGQFWMVF